jgi:hypothetical protein
MAHDITSEAERLAKQASGFRAVARLKRREIIVCLHEAERLETIAYRLTHARCSFCGGAWHPASGAWYSDRARACYRCVQELWTWHRKRMNGRPRGGGPSFYDHVFPQ